MHVLPVALLLGVAMIESGRRKPSNKNWTSSDFAKWMVANRNFRRRLQCFRCICNVRLVRKRVRRKPWDQTCSRRLHITAIHNTNGPHNFLIDGGLFLSSCLYLRYDRPVLYIVRSCTCLEFLYTRVLGYIFVLTSWVPAYCREPVP